MKNVILVLILLVSAMGCATLRSREICYAPVQTDTPVEVKRAFNECQLLVRNWRSNAFESCMELRGWQTNECYAGTNEIAPGRTF